MSYGVSNETPWNSDAYDTKNATILKEIQKLIAQIVSHTIQCYAFDVK